MFCGKIFCIGGNEYPVTGQKAIISTLRGLCHIAGDGSEGNNLSMVPTGTKCGHNKVWTMFQQVFFYVTDTQYDVSLLRFNRFAMISRARTWTFTAVMKAVRSNAMEEGWVKNLSSRAEHAVYIYNKIEKRHKCCDFCRSVTRRMNVTVIRAGLHLTATFNIHNSLPVNTPHIIHNAKFTLHDFRPDLQVMELADRSGVRSLCVN